MIGNRASHSAQGGVVTIEAGQPRPGAAGDVRFVPARWLVLLLAVAARLLFNGGRISKFGIAGLVWAFTPRKLKIAAAGVAVAATIVLVGAIAAIMLLALQLM